MCDLIDTTIENVRNLAIRLRPGILDHLGLVEAIEWVTADFEKRYGITCVFKNSDDPEIRGHIATAAYRIVQEALTNVARHASATRTTVSMSIVDRQLRFTIADNGGGFDPQTVGDSVGLGMTNMRERATLVGGFFELQSALGKGTRISFTVPLPASNPT
jgi:signal transduction histidine kinase